MSQARSGRASGAPVFGIFLLFLGIVFILQATNVLSWGLWGTLWRFWSVVIIIFGIGILMHHRSPWLVSLIAVVILGGSLGIALWLHGPAFPGEIITTTVPLEDLDRAEIRIDVDAVVVELGSLLSGSTDLARIDAEEVGRRPGMLMDLQQSGGVGQLHLRSTRSGSTTVRGVGGRVFPKWWVDLTRNIALSITVDSAASNLDLDFRDLDVERLTLEVDAGNCEVTLPAAAGVTRVDVDANAANIEIVVPDGVAARIWVDSTLGIVQIDRRRFPRRGDLYESPDFADADNRVEINIEISVGRVAVR